MVDGPKDKVYNREKGDLGTRLLKGGECRNPSVDRKEPNCLKERGKGGKRMRCVRAAKSGKFGRTSVKKEQFCSEKKKRMGKTVFLRIRRRARLK